MRLGSLGWMDLVGVGLVGVDLVGVDLAWVDFARGSLDRADFTEGSLGLALDVDITRFLLEKFKKSQENHFDDQEVYPYSSMDKEISSNAKLFIKIYC